MFDAFDISENCFIVQSRINEISFSQFLFLTARILNIFTESKSINQLNVF